MKKILLGAFLLLSVFLIYLGTLDRKVYYLSLGDSFALGVTPYGNQEYGYGDYIVEYLQENDLFETYIPDFAQMGYRTTDLLRDIEDNRKIIIAGKEKTLKNALIKADLVTLSIGANDILAKLETYQSFSTQEMYDHIDESLTDFEKLLTKIREYCKEDIIVIGTFNYLHRDELDTFLEYYNKRAEEISHQHNISYVDLYEDFQNSTYFPNPKDIHPSKEGYQAISHKIIEMMQKTLLKK